MEPKIIADSLAEDEMLGLVRRRLVALFAVGFVATIVRYFVQLSTFGPTSERTDLLAKSVQPYFDLLYLSTPIILGLGLIAIYFFGRRLSSLYWIGSIVVLLVILIAISGHALFTPGSDGLFIISAILFMFAALIPIPTALYVAICGISLIAYPVLFYLMATTISDVGDYWEMMEGVSGLKGELLFNSTSLFVLCCVTIFVNYSLYALRKRVGKLEKMGSYQVKTVLGEGGMGVVYAAEHALLQRASAIKVLKERDYHSSEAISRFEREVKLSSMLTHPNTITIFDYGRTADNTLFYVMELLEGLDLQKVASSFGPMPFARLIFVMRQVCGSLSEAHNRGLVHRDIKPSNIFLTDLGGMYDFVKVLDFGLARTQKIDPDYDLTQGGGFYGSPSYTSPEIIRETSEIDGRSDIYSLGVTMHYLLTLQRLFPAPSTADLLSHHLNTEPKPPSLIAELSIPPELDSIVLRCLAKDPAHRYQNVEDLSADLRDVPCDEPWSFEAAKEWWDIHMKDGNKYKVCNETGDLLLPKTDSSSNKTIEIRRQISTST